MNSDETKTVADAEIGAQILLDVIENFRTEI